MDTMAGIGKRTLIEEAGRIALATAAILLVPLVAMLLTDEVKWGALDFVVAALLLGGTGFAYTLLARRMRQVKQRIVIGALLLAALLLVWAELAVGVFGTPFAGT